MTIHILSNISQSKRNQTMTFGEVIKYITRKIFSFKNHAENEAQRLVPDLIFFKKRFIWCR